MPTQRQPPAQRSLAIEGTHPTFWMRRLALRDRLTVDEADGVRVPFNSGGAANRWKQGDRQLATESDEPQATLLEQEFIEPVGREGAEDESDLETHAAQDFSAAVSSTDWTVETLVSQMRKGRIDLNPRFQRRNAWLDQRKSQLIESIMLRYPIPQLVLAEKPDAQGTYLVIDGKQRLLALRQFTVDPDEPRDVEFDALRLRGLEIRRDLNGLTWHEILTQDPNTAASFENHTIRTVLLSGWKSEDLLLSLFLRLNTGSVTLSPQELRQALHPGRFSDWVDGQSAASRALQSLLGLDKPDRRMVDAELLLRHIALQLSPLAYRSNLKRFLDDSSGVFNEGWPRWEPQLEGALAELEAGIAAAQVVFGEHVCRKWTGSRFERPFNRAIFDVQTVAFADPVVRSAAATQGNRLVDEFEQLCESDAAFVRSVTATTKTGGAFRTRLEAWRRAVAGVTGHEFALPPCLYRPDSA